MTEPLFAKLRELYKEANPNGISVWSCDAELNKDAILMMAAVNELPKLFAALDLMELELQKIANGCETEFMGDQMHYAPWNSDTMAMVAEDALAKVREMGR